HIATVTVDNVISFLSSQTSPISKKVSIYKAFSSLKTLAIDRQTRRQDKIYLPVLCMTPKARPERWQGKDYELTEREKGETEMISSEVMATKWSLSSSFSPQLIGSF
ncbi:hypothetical protein MUK42_36693, partial [Musa troglodytarum]